MKIEELKCPPSVKDSLKIGLIASEAFHDDSISLNLAPAKYQFVNWQGKIQNIRDPETKLNEIQRFGTVWKHHVWLYTWWWYHELSRPGIRVFIGYSEDDIPVGLAIWSIPYPLREVPSTLQVLIYWLRKVRALLYRTVLQWRFPGLNPRALPVTKSLLNDIEKQLQFNHTKQRETYLVGLTAEKRRNTPYTTDLTYFLMLFAISQRGKGYGTQFFKSIDLEPQPFTLRGERFDPQLALISSPMGVALYKKNGFRVVRTAARELGHHPFKRYLMICG